MSGIFCFYQQISYLRAIGCAMLYAEYLRKMKKNISIYDIAKSLNVSASTVSRALQDHPRISAEVRKMVQKKAREMNYKPNRMAVNLKLGKSNTIGVVVPNINRNFFSSVIDGIEEEAYREGYDVLICQSQESFEKEKKILNSLSQGRVDGVIASIASGTHSYDHFNNLEDDGIPLVLFDRVADNIHAGKVMIDDYRGAYMVVEHLLKQGRKRIFHCASHQHVSVWERRCHGYLDAMKAHGFEPEKDWIIYGEISQNQGQNAARQIIQMENKPDAVFCTSDFIALGMMLEFLRNGIRIPDDIAICGFANEPMDALVTPSLSSVDQFSKQMGQQAARMLFAKINGEVPADVMLMPELIVRDSTVCVQKY